MKKYVEINGKVFEVQVLDYDQKAEDKFRKQEARRSRQYRNQLANRRGQKKIWDAFAEANPYIA